MPNKSSADCEPISLDQSNFEHLIRSQISPVVIIITFITNVVVSIVLTRPHMISPTNIILLGIAISNLLNGLVPLPIYVAKLNLNFINNNTVYKSFVNYYLTVTFPTIFHTTTVWLTVILALQRYLYISLPVTIHHYWTIRSSRFCVSGIYLMSAISHCIPFMIVFQSHGTGTVLKCMLVSDKVLMIYYWLRVCLINIIPCLILATLTILIIRALGEAHRNHQRLVHNASRRTNASRKSENLSNSISKMLLVVLIIFLTVEIPAGTTIAAYTVGKTFDAKLNDHIMTYIITTCDLVVLMSYPFNFVVYYVMSEQFRTTYTAVMCKCYICHVVNRDFEKDKTLTTRMLQQTET